MGDDPEGRRQGRSRRMAFARCRGAYSGDDRAGDRRAHRALLHLGPHQGAARLPRDQGAGAGAAELSIDRVPTFCSGCPHNTSTNVPEGSRALAGIGCHYMATWMPERHTGTFTQMGGEGVPWVGQAPFTTEEHVFANLGDGTYFHSGLLAIRQAVAAKVNITYKILYNDAVAMTGGQPHDGELSVPRIVRQLEAEGAQHRRGHRRHRPRLWPRRPVPWGTGPPPRRTRRHPARPAANQGCPR